MEMIDMVEASRRAVEPTVELAHLIRETGNRPFHHDAGGNLLDRQGPNGRRGNAQFGEPCRQLHR